MNTTKNINYFEEQHSEWLRNSQVFETVNKEPLAYVIVDTGNNYSYGVFGKVAFTANDAFRMACEIANERENRWGSRYSDFLLVTSLNDESDLWGLDGFNYQETELAILFCGSDGEVFDKVTLYGVKEYKTGETK